MLNNKDDPYSEWDDLKFTVAGLLLLASPVFFIVLLVVVVLDLLT